jgi:hypothetical protein
MLHVPSPLLDMFNAQDLEKSITKSGKYIERYRVIPEETFF